MDLQHATHEPDAQFDDTPDGPAWRRPAGA
jgi:hypothetical protein